MGELIDTLAILITIRKRNLKRILRQAGYPNSEVDSDEEETPVPA
jgi:hypothetical protein